MIGTASVPRSAPIIVRAGVPQVYGQLVSGAAAAGIPVLFSANAFALTNADGEFSRFNLSAARKLPQSLDAALDSAGFVAMSKYNGYRWTEEQYMQLVASRPWAWWAAMDACVEPPVAGALVTKEIRIQQTVLGYHRCKRLARTWGVPAPMPVIQGWHPDDYLRCIELMALRDEEWPALIGVGSMCRRHIYGTDGIAAVLEVLDKALPAHVGLHLFGVKGGSVKLLGNSPRFASLDSMAWDFRARAQQRTGRTQAFRLEQMLQWQISQEQIVPDLYRPQPRQGELELTFGDRMDAASVYVPEPPEVVVHRAVAAWHSDCLLAEHGYRDVAWRALQQAELITQILKAFGHEHLAASTDMADMAAYDALAEAGYVPPRNPEDQSGCGGRLAPRADSDIEESRANARQSDDDDRRVGAA